MKIKAWMDFDSDEKVLKEEIYFKKPKTPHGFSWIVAVPVTIIYKKNNKRNKK